MKVYEIYWTTKSDSSVKNIDQVEAEGAAQALFEFGVSVGMCEPETDILINFIAEK